MDMVIDFPGRARLEQAFQSVRSSKRSTRPRQRKRLSAKGISSISFVPRHLRWKVCARLLPSGKSSQHRHTHPSAYLPRSHPTRLIEKIQLEIQVPPSLPPQYHSALIHPAELCKVKKTLEQPPLSEIVVDEGEAISPLPWRTLRLHDVRPVQFVPEVLGGGRAGTMKECLI